MLYKFKSRAAGDLIMLEANGRRVLEIIGKDAGSQGIILPEQIPGAIAALQAAIALEESRDIAGKGNAKSTADADSEAEADADAAVPSEGLSLRHRAVPFIDMLERNHKAGHEVVWGT